MEMSGQLHAPAALPQGKIPCCGGISTFRKTCCLHLQGETWYPTATLHGITTQRTSTWIFTSVKARNLAWGYTVSNEGWFGKDIRRAAAYFKVTNPVSMNKPQTIRITWSLRPVWIYLWISVLPLKWISGVLYHLGMKSGFSAVK